MMGTRTALGDLRGRMAALALAVAALTGCANREQGAGEAPAAAVPTATEDHATCLSAAARQGTAGYVETYAECRLRLARERQR